MRQIQAAYDGLADADARRDGDRVRAGVGDRHRPRRDPGAGARGAPHRCAPRSTAWSAPARAATSRCSTAAASTPTNAPALFAERGDRRRAGGRRVARGGVVLEDRGRRVAQPTRSVDAPELTSSGCGCTCRPPEPSLAPHRRTAVEAPAGDSPRGSVMYALLLVLHLLVCLAPRSASCSSSPERAAGLRAERFGGSAQTVFGGRGATDFVTRATMVLGGCVLRRRRSCWR